VLSATSRPWPNDVRPPVFSRSIAAVTSACSAVGCWVTSAPAPNATSPMSIDEGWAATKRRATSWATARRVGATSSAPMLLDTSTTTSTVPLARERARVASGRERAKIITASAAIRSANGTWRRGPSRRAPPAVSRPDDASAEACRARRRWSTT
jgi:hypothetical protein